MGKNKSSDLLSMKDASYYDIYLILKELYITTFRWENLPPTVNPRYLEESLFEQGQVIFFKDDAIGYLALRGNLSSQLDHYGEPVNITAYGNNAYRNDNLKNHVNAVVIYNNYIRSTPQKRIEQYAQRIFNIEKTIDVNVQLQKTPFLIGADKNTLLSLKNVFSQYDQFEVAIYIDNLLKEEINLNYQELHAPFIADKLQQLKKQLWNEVLSYIGIQNNSSEKTERLTQDEVLISNGLAIASKNSRLLAHEVAVEEINRLFGLDINVDINNVLLQEIERSLIGDVSRETPTEGGEL